MKEQRKNTRFETQAKAVIKEIGKEEFPLKDISVTGCRIECPIEKDVMPNMQFTLQIFPESAAEIEPFNITAETKWVKVGVCTCEAGFLLLESPKKKQFQRYVDYLSWRYSQGLSITGKE